MSAPTGEAVNYETTVAELEALANEQRGHVDHCQAALKSIGDAKSAINNMQESYRASAAAASLTSEHLAAKNLDGVTLANAGTTADAMPAGAVDQMYDQLEAMEAEASARLADAEVALGATAANLAHVVATYSAAHETVAGNLSGDSSFLDSYGGLSAGQAGGNHLAGTAAGLTGTVDPFSAGPGGSGGGGSDTSGGEAGGQSSGGAGSTGSGSKGGKVYNDPVDARGQNFGTGNVYNLAPGEKLPPEALGGGGGKTRSHVTNTFLGPVSAEGSHSGTGSVTNNWGSKSDKD